MFQGMVPSSPAGFSQDVREWHNIQDRVGTREVYKFGRYTNLYISWNLSPDHMEPFTNTYKYIHIPTYKLQNTYIYIHILSHTCKCIPDTYNTHTPKSYINDQVRNSIILGTFSLEMEYMQINTFTYI